MKTFRVEVFADQRPVLLPKGEEIVNATNLFAAAGRAARQTKAAVKRNRSRPRQLTVRVSLIHVQKI
jgi:hypothetical protein